MQRTNLYNIEIEFKFEIYIHEINMKYENQEYDKTIIKQRMERRKRKCEIIIKNTQKSYLKQEDKLYQNIKDKRYIINHKIENKILYLE